MHEWGIVESLIQEVIERSKENGLETVDKVFVSLGRDDHLTPAALKLCFSVLAKGTILEKTELEIQEGEDNGVMINRIEGSTP